MRHSPLLAALALTLLAGAVRAHNGAVALAAPATGIRLDGDLSDWPADLRRYPIARAEYGAWPLDAEELERFVGRFKTEGAPDSRLEDMLADLGGAVDPERLRRALRRGPEPKAGDET